MNEMFICIYDSYKNPVNWIAKLRNNPNLADECPWQNLLSIETAYIIEDNPSLIDRCALDSLDDRDWYIILGSHPSLQKYCPWHLIDKTGEDWEDILRLNPQFRVAHLTSQVPTQFDTQVPLDVDIFMNLPIYTGLID